MWLSFYHPEVVGDVLLLTKGAIERTALEVESIENVTLIRHKETKEVMAMNVFQVSQWLSVEGKGQVVLTDEQLTTLNDLLAQKGIAVTIEVDRTPKFVVGVVEKCVPHEDSDHLSVTQTNVGDEVLQIVCGAKNVAAGKHVLVAKIGAVMPSGLIIWQGELRGVASHGMLCSTRELALTHLQDLPGIWELPSSFAAGTPLAEVVAKMS